jgi:hypothetical protein
MKPAAVVVVLCLCTHAFAFDASHAAWNGWLKEFASVSGATTTVNYKAAKAKRGGLDKYLAGCEAVSRKEFDGWKEPDRMAFLINMYNAETVRLIVDNYPVKSIKDLGSLFSSPWKKKFFKLFGEEQNLDGIEHGMLRKDWSEPRVHFAVVCASKGCPQLRGEAYTGGRLEAQLEDQAVKFLHDKGKNRYDAKENKFFLSKIFDWYGGDFVKKAGSVQAFVTPRMAAASDDRAKMAKADLSFNDYDWTLNETPGAGG